MIYITEILILDNGVDILLRMEYLGKEHVVIFERDETRGMYSFVYKKVEFEKGCPKKVKEFVTKWHEYRMSELAKEFLDNEYLSPPPPMNSEELYNKL